MSKLYIYICIYLCWLMYMSFAIQALWQGQEWKIRPQWIEIMFESIGLWFPIDGRRRKRYIVWWNSWYYRSKSVCCLSLYMQFNYDLYDFNYMSYSWVISNTLIVRCLIFFLILLYKIAYSYKISKLAFNYYSRIDINNVI